MDALKWILKASIVVAMAFFGLSQENQESDKKEPSKNSAGIFQLINR